MQRLLVIFALGLGLLLPACAVQDLPFSGSTADQDNAAPAPYRPQQGAVHDGSNDGGGESFVPQPIPADRVPMPAGVNSPPAQGMQQPAPSAQGMPANQGAPAAAPAAPKPVTKTATGLQEREL